MYFLFFNIFFFFSRYGPKYYIPIRKTKDIFKDEENVGISTIYLNRNVSDVLLSSLSIEHVCPRSYCKNLLCAKYDMHNLFLTDSDINRMRSNYKFIDEKCVDYYLGVGSGVGSGVELGKGNYKYNNMFIPRWSSRGVVARSIAYMKFIYPKMVLNNIIDMDVLIDWDYLYPPLDWEIARNKLIYKYQENINPFVEKLLDIEIINCVEY